MLLIKLVRSPIGHTSHQRKVIRALGLRKVNQAVEHPDNSSVRGMIRRVEHLVSVEAVEGAPIRKPRAAKAAAVAKAEPLLTPAADALPKAEAAPVAKPKKEPGAKTVAASKTKVTKPKPVSPKPQAKSTKE